MPEQNREPNTRLGVPIGVRGTVRLQVGPDRSDAGGNFGDFYRAEYARAVRFAWLLTGTSSVAEDIVQEAFISTGRNFQALDRPVQYLNVAIVNRTKTWHRDERRNRLKMERLAHRQEVALPPEDADLLDIVGKLPHRQKVAIVTRYWCGWSESEIAQALGCRPGTVKSLASRALSRLQREVGT